MQSPHPLFGWQRAAIGGSVPVSPSQSLCIPSAFREAVHGGGGGGAGSQAPNVPNVFIWRSSGASSGGDVLGHCRSNGPWPPDRAFMSVQRTSTRATRGLICASEYSPLGTPGVPRCSDLALLALACTDAHWPLFVYLGTHLLSAGCRVPDKFETGVCAPSSSP